MMSPKCIFTKGLAALRTACFAVLAVGLVSMVAAPSFAAEPTWTVTQATGDVQYRISGASWQALREGQVLGAAAEVRTGKDGRAVLSHQTTTMTAAPESHVALPKAERPKGVYKVFQNLGTLLYRIKKRATSMAAFEVETPFMAAVVKGTVFTVNTTPKGATVHLTEGIVVTQPTLGGQGVTLKPGETARISSKPGADVTVKGKNGAKHSKATAPKAKKKTEAKKPAKVKVTKAPAAKAGAPVKVAKKVTIIKRTTTAKPVHVRHPRAVPIFAANNRGGLFAKGVTVRTAFKKKDANSQALGLGKAVDVNVVVSTVRANQGTTGKSGLGASGGAAVSAIASTTNNAGGLGGGISPSVGGAPAVGLGGGTPPGLGGAPSPSVGGAPAVGLGGGTPPGLSGGTPPGHGGTPRGTPPGKGKKA